MTNNEALEIRIQDETQFSLDDLMEGLVEQGLSIAYLDNLSQERRRVDETIDLIKQEITRRLNSLNNK